VWYYTRDRKPQGPVTFEQLGELARTGVLAGQELVWQEGMAQWAEAQSISGLFPTPPPLPPVELPKPVEEEPVIEIVAEEPADPPIVATPEPEPATPLSGTPEESPAPSPEKATSDFLHRVWDSKQTGPAVTEEPIQVEPEFTLDFAGAPTPPIRRKEESPTVDLVFPAESAVEPVTIQPEIELAPVEPRLELGEPEETAPATPYGVGGGWKKSNTPEIVPVVEAQDSHPETYPVAGLAQPDIPEAEAIAAIPLATAVPPLAIPVPANEEPPYEESETEQRARLRRSYVQAKKEWTSVRKGLNVIYITSAIWFALLCGRIIINTAIALITGESPSATEQSASGSAVSITILFIMAIVVDSLTIYGFILCLKVPESTGARVMVIATLALTGASIFFVLLTPFFLPMVFIALGAGFCRWFAFVFFLQTVNHSFEAHLQMKSIERLLLLMGVTTGVTVLLWLATAYLVQVFARGEQDTAAEITKILASLCLNLPLVALFGLCTIRYLRALRDTVALIDERLYRGEIG
jgi:hypothetical protein